MSGRLKLSELRGLVRKSKEKTDKIHNEQVAKRLKRRPINASTVERWFDKGLKEKYGDAFKSSDWGVKERTLASKLLKTYGPELVKDAVAYMFRRWDHMVDSSRGRLYGVPTINLLWGMKSSVFGGIQASNAGKAPSVQGKSPVIKRPQRDSDEYRKESDSPGIGW